MIYDPHPSQLGFAYRKHLAATPSPFLALRAEGGRELADAERRAAECGARDSIYFHDSLPPQRRGAPRSAALELKVGGELS